MKRIVNIFFAVCLMMLPDCSELYEVTDTLPDILPSQEGIFPALVVDEKTVKYGDSLASVEKKFPQCES